MRVAANMPVYKRRQFRSTFGFDLMLPPTSHSLGLDRLLGRTARAPQHASPAESVLWLTSITNSDAMSFH